MESILDQFENTPAAETFTPPPIVKEEKKKKTTTTKKKETTSSVEVEEKREQLSILAVLGTIEEYTGAKLSLGDVKKLSAADVEKYHNRYQLKMGNQVSGSLVNMSIDGATEILNYFLPIDDKKELCTDLKKNEILKQELNNAAGYAVLKGGRFVALGSVVLQVAKHLKFTTSEEKNKTE